MKRDGMSNQDSIFPAIGKPVVPLAQVDADERTLITQQRRYSASLYTPPIYMLPEKALKFWVDEALIRAEQRKHFQFRGLLRLKDEYELYGYEKNGDPYVQIVKAKHLELKFAPSEPAMQVEFSYGQDIRKIRIDLADIESVSLKRRLLTPRLIVKCKYEPPDYSLKVDPVDLEVVLYISWKDIALAKSYLSAVKTLLSDRELKHLLNTL